MSVVLGLDAGGTKTLAALVARDGTVRDIVEVAGLDPTAGAAPERDMRARLDAVAARTGPVLAATLGLPYHGELAEISAMQQRVAVSCLGPDARVVNDVEVAHYGAFAGGEGILCLSGTGSMAWAVGPAGMARAGGYGPLIGDEGSAFDIGRRALQRLSMEIDGRCAQSAFGAALRAHLDLPPAGLIDWIYAQDVPRAGIAGVARQVSRLAGDGDAEARDLLLGAAEALACSARAAGRAAGLAEGCVWASGGSVFNDQVVRDEVARRLGGPPRTDGLSAVGGAAVHAARRAGWTVDEAFVARLRATLDQTYSRTGHQVDQ